MIHLILIAVLVMGLIGAIFAVLLYFVARKFKVEESPLIDEIEAVLPGANCGGCGKAGCRALAEAIVKQGNMDGLHCSVGGELVANKIAKIIGCEVKTPQRQVAVLHCNGTCTNAVAKSDYDGLRDCTYVNTLYSGESGCAFGCLGFGNCVAACKFGAMTMDPITGIPHVNEDKCVGCGACAKACPRNIIEMRNAGEKFRRVYVACSNMEKGAAARMNCTVACIGCGKCERTCPIGAIHVQQNLAYIDYNICDCCGLCADACPTGAILKVNFPVEGRANENI